MSIRESGKGGSSELLDVKDYGARGDGTTDDTVAIQAAFTAAGAAGGTALIPPGTYAVTAQLTLGRSANLVMSGATLKATATITGALLVVGDLTNWWRDKYLQGGYIDCNNNADHALQMLSGLASSIEGVTWKNPKMHGMILGDAGAALGSHEMHVSKCKGDKTASVAVIAGSIGIWATSKCFDSVFVDNVMVGPDVSFQTDGGGNTHISGHGYGISTNVQFPSTVFKDSGSDNIYIGCYPDTPSTYGYWFTSNSYRWSVIGGRIYNGALGYDNVVVAIHIDQVAGDPNIGSIVGVKVSGADSSHRIALDYDGYIGSSHLKAVGNQTLNVVSHNLDVDVLQTTLCSRLKMIGTAPTIAAGAAIGTSPPTPTVDSHSRDQGGQVQLGTGTSPTTGALCTVTFSTAYQLTPFVTVTPNNAATAALGLYVSSINTSGFVVSCQTAPTGSLTAGSLLASFAVSVGA